MKLAAALLLLLSTPSFAQDVTSVVGTPPAFGGYSGDGGPATSAQLRDPQGIAFDGAGNLYIADNRNAVIRRVDATSGIITTIAGNGTEGFSGDGGPATAAQLWSPVGICADQNGNVFIAEAGNNRIRRVDAVTGVIQTVAGNGMFGFAGDGGQATSARLNGPQGVTVAANGNIYIADSGNFRVRKVNSITGIITTVAGTGFPSSGGDGGPATSATFASPRRITVDLNTNLIILDRTSNARVRRIDGITGIISTIAGGGSMTGDTGPATQMNLGPLTDIAIDGCCNVIATASFRAWRITGGTITAFAGTGAQGYGGDGGPAIQAVFNNISGAAVKASGEVFLSDRSNNLIRKVGLASSAVADEPSTPRAFALHANQPNPFNRSTSIRFDLPEASRVSLRVFDVQERLVRSLGKPGVLPAGQHVLTWDGRIESGLEAAPGVYFYALKAGEFRAVRKMVVVR